VCVPIVFAACAGLASAQGFPTRPISFIVPYGPGSGNDIIARLIAQKIGDGMGHPLVVDNRNGAAGAILKAEIAHWGKVVKDSGVKMQ
jgi:tripartite-type tricarboxylate transporter receptor subunit TctC